jgi:hypothetical protein
MRSAAKPLRRFDEALQHPFTALVQPAQAPLRLKVVLVSRQHPERRRRIGVASLPV